MTASPVHARPPDRPCQSQHLPGADCRLPPLEFCHRCGTNTAGVMINLRSGLIGNCCAVCRACRKGRPYAGRWDLPSNNHNAGLTGIGVHHESPFYS